MASYLDNPWTFHGAPNFGGQIIASDPSISIDGGIHRMNYTDLVAPTYTTTIARATSPDGRSWTPGGIVIPYGVGDQACAEAACIFKVGAKYVLLYSTYADKLPHMPSTMRVAVSSDGTTFAKTAYFMAPTPNWYDHDLIFSPTVIAWQGAYLMIYCGHAYTGAAPNGNVGCGLLSATSPDGLTWTKGTERILKADAAIPWMNQGAAEPSLLLGPDNTYYLFFTGGGPDGWTTIGCATAVNPLGPWKVDPKPIITPQIAGMPAGSVVIAPHCELVGGMLRMWYTEVTPAGLYSVAYAESNWGVTGTQPPEPPEPEVPPDELAIGGDAVVIFNSTAVRSNPWFGRTLWRANIGATGKLTAGPQTVGRYVYWKVDFPSNPDGWVAEYALSPVQTQGG